MKLNLSRLDVDLLLKLIEAKQKAKGPSSLAERNRLFKLQDMLLRFREDVWGDSEKEA